MIEQTIIVSIKGPNIATKPSLIGSVVFAAPCAIVSVPVPASFENNPRLTPMIIIDPIAPPATASPEKASWKIIPITLGMLEKFLIIIMIAAIK